MMPSFSIDYEKSRTEVLVKPGALREAGRLLRNRIPHPSRPRVVVIADERVAKLYASTLCESIGQAGFELFPFRIAPGERSKSLAVVDAAYRFLVKNHIGRDGVIVALGGGVVGDLAGFVAATWMRGVRFANCPTTLEAAIDASIGGKTAINVPGGKNLVGAFHQPILVVVDPTCLNTLDMRDVRAGLAESIKHALISSEDFLLFHEAKAEAILSLDPVTISELILTNLRTKARIVEQDVHERSGLRMMLNFGHTIGHAVEEACGFTLRHGECVALGMLAACRLSHARGLLDDAVIGRVEVILRRLGLPTKLDEPIDTATILEVIRSDKKVHDGVQRFVLLEKIGHPIIQEALPWEQIGAAYESLRP